MKDIKTFLIGFLTCCCLFLIMGQTENNVMENIKTFVTENGRYQISTTSDSYTKGHLKDIRVLETTFDTRTGEIIKREQYTIQSKANPSSKFYLLPE